MVYRLFRYAVGYGNNISLTVTEGSVLCGALFTGDFFRFMHDEKNRPRSKRSAAFIVHMQIKNSEGLIMRKILAVVLTLALVFLSVSALADTLRVGMECNYAPFNWTQEDETEFTVPIEGGAGYADGYDVQIARKVAEGLGMDLVIVKTEWDGLPMGVQTGAIDAIIAGMSPTEKRRATIDFTDAYYTSQLVIVVSADGAYANATSLADFAGAKITGQLNTFHYSVIDQIPGVNKQMAMNTFPEMIVALNSGVIDGYIAEEPGAVADTTANEGLIYISFAEENGFEASEEDVSIAIGVQQGSELTEKINEILAGIDADTRLQMMLDATDRQPLLN